MSKERQELSSPEVKGDKALQAAIVLRDIDSKTNKLKEGVKVKDNYNGNTNFNNYQGAVIANLGVMAEEVRLLRMGDDKNPALDISFGKYASQKLGISCDEKGSVNNLLQFLGLNGQTTIHKLQTMPQFNDDFTWLVPEVIRDAIRTGYITNPIWESITASDTMVSNTLIKTPQIKFPDVPMPYLAEGETIPLGNIEFAQKIINIFKVGTGFEISDEVRMYTSIDTLSEYFNAVGINLTQRLDALAVLTLINGDLNGNNAAPIIGVENINSFDYDNDLLRTVIRMALLNYTTNTIIANEKPAREFMTMPEIKGFDGGTRLGGATFQTGNGGVPTQFRMMPSAVMPAEDQLLFLDPNRALQKYTARPLFIEMDRKPSTQMSQSYATITTGFGKFMDDASVIVDKSIDFATNGFPDFMDAIGSYEKGFDEN